MLRFRLFRLPRAKSYNYIPVFYDKRKEQLEKKMHEQNTNNHQNRIKGSFKRSSNLKSKSEASKSNIRLIIIILILTFLALYFLYS